MKLLIKFSLTAAFVMVTYVIYYCQFGDNLPFTAGARMAQLNGFSPLDAIRNLSNVAQIFNH